MQIIVNYLLTVAQAFGLSEDPGPGTVRAFRGACDCLAGLVSARIDELGFSVTGYGSVETRNRKRR